MHHYFVPADETYSSQRYWQMRQESRLMPWMGGAFLLHLALLAVLLPKLPQYPSDEMGAPILVSLMKLTKAEPVSVTEPVAQQREEVKPQPKHLEKAAQSAPPVMATPVSTPEIAPVTEQIKQEASSVKSEAPILPTHTEEKIAASSTEHVAPVEEKIEPPKFGVAYLNNPAPEYPSLSKRKGDEGRVLLKVLVSAAGKAEDVQIEKSSGFELLDEAALKTVKKWQFIPARKGAEALSAYVIVPIKFALNN